ncbi:MAG: 30S ribosomal protein S6 [Chloroflexi bacterium]|nr:MAG: 30S ribosomal protein S6 [Chloroflexota bacterium]
MNRDYELGFILNPEVSEEQTRAILGRVEQVVANHSGQIVRVNQWGRRRLGYPIEHHRDGFYVFIDMILTPESVIELDRTLKVSEEVLRHLIKRRDPKTVQKEREARAATVAATPAPTAPEAEAEPQDEMQTPGENESAGEEAAIPSDLSAETIEDEDIPAAIEEPTEA